ncbi:MAG: DUF305 domain-containing protein [Actinobacteria bacterium]|uniref:Unannotated protein n=1 Tax=freshwater metagenome TaxID=449393 RepID=A0A6J6U2P2_9ZZZZ|nr:DUF305 domain-containing protein [Actinomycetota bacterium]
MQINIDKKSGIFVAIIAALLVVIAAISFSSGRGEHSGMHDMGMHEGNEKDSDKPAMYGSDQMFLQMMIPHHEQAIQMSEFALTRSKNAEVLKLSQQIKDGQSAELIQMKSWLADAGVSADMGHEMDHGMGGMMSDEDMSTLESSTDAAFDKFFLTSMIAHHEGALHMVLMIKDSNDPQLVELGHNIMKTQSAEIEWMKKILG